MRGNCIQAEEQPPKSAVLAPFSIKLSGLFVFSVLRLPVSRPRARVSGKSEDPAGESQRVLLVPFLPVPRSTL